MSGLFLAQFNDDRANATSLLSVVQRPSEPANVKRSV